MWPVEATIKGTLLDFEKFKISSKKSGEDTSNITSDLGTSFREFCNFRSEEESANSEIFLPILGLFLDVMHAANLIEESFSSSLTISEPNLPEAPHKIRSIHL